MFFSSSAEHTSAGDESSPEQIELKLIQSKEDIEHPPSLNFITSGKNPPSLHSWHQARSVSLTTVNHIGRSWDLRVEYHPAHAKK